MVYGICRLAWVPLRGSACCSSLRRIISSPLFIAYIVPSSNIPPLPTPPGLSPPPPASPAVRAASATAAWAMAGDLTSMGLSSGRVSDAFGRELVRAVGEGDEGQGAEAMIAW